jgi:membrane protease YdiL (CAAX protease family)
LSRVFVVAVGFEAGLGLLAVVLGWILGCPPAATVTLDTHGVLVGLAATAPMLVAFIAMSALPWEPLQRIRRHLDQTLLPMLAPLGRWHLALLSAAAGFGEELLFRGLIQQSLAGLVGTWPALALASLVFGLAHPITAAYVVLAAVIGAYLGWLWLFTGNLAVPIVAHAAYDFAALVLMLSARERAERRPAIGRSDADA